MTRRLPCPWRAEKFSGGYVVRDANGFAVAYVYGRSTEDEAIAAKQMTMDEARRVASNIAKLPEMLKRGNSVRAASQLVDEIASDVLPPQGVAIVLTERSGSRCPFWLARPPSERFCSDRGRTSGHCFQGGAWDRGLALLETPPVPASRYIHPEFGFFCPTPPFRRRLRVALACLVVAGVGAAVMATADGLKLAAAVTRADEASIAETTRATSLAPFATVVTRLPIVAGAQTTAGKSSCVGDTRTEGNCVSVKLRKPRMVWVANNRPAIAAVALGRSAAPTTGSIAAHTGSQGDPARAGEAAVVAATTEPQNAVATPKNKKAQKSARGQNHRRDQYQYGTPSWREVRVDDWATRGYARDYQWGVYGRGGFTPNF